ncbi:MAG: SH3 domain-containing protein [Gemmataceae bacterium]|nr:SH3 domain-containing protein [Gemmataceae bacterium]
MKEWVFISWLVLSQGAVPSGAGTPYSARITIADAETRSGPSFDAKLYLTNRLRTGDTVVVEQERPDGWLAIRPPEGSFSWVNAKNLQRISPNQPNYLVQVGEGAQAPVFMGSSLVNSKPTAESVKLSRGTQVRAIGSPQVDGKDSWIPIVPPVGEVRYIRCETIGKQAVAINVAGTPPATVPGPLATAAGSTAVTPTQGDCDPLTRWNQAVQMEQSGNLQEAVRLYSKVGQDFSYRQPAMATQAYSRATWMQECQRQGVKNTWQVCPPAQPRIVSPATPVSINPASPVPVQLATQANPVPVPASVGNGQPCLPGGARPSILRRSGRSIDRNPAYYLESPQGKPLIYVMPAPGQSLEYFVNQRVEVNGPTAYRGDLRAYVLTAWQIQPR